MTIYLDHNATTALRPAVAERYQRLLVEASANPSSLHAPGRRARQVLDEAREDVADALGIHEDEVQFVSSGTVANNLVWAGVAAVTPPDHGLVTSAIEHSAVLEPARVQALAGRRLTILEVDDQATIQLDGIETAAQAGPLALVSLQAANNEVGSVLDLAKVRERLEGLPGPRPLLHSDCVQALGRLPLSLAQVDLASFSAHKLGGPLGVGILVRRKGVALEPMLHGGGQENAYWPGTENVPAIGAAALAVRMAVAEREAFAAHTSALIHELWQGLVDGLPEVRLLGPALDQPRLPNTLNISLPGLDGRVLVTRLDMAGLAVSAGSACASGSLEPSHVLQAMGLSDEEARAGLRLSLGRSTTREDIHNAVDILRKTLV